MPDTLFPVKSLNFLNGLLNESTICRSYKINMAALQSYSDFEANRWSPEFDLLIKELNLIKSPSVYWFETKDIDTANEIHGKIEEYRKTPSRNGRVIPVSNNYANTDSKVLYVGQRKGGGRKKPELSWFAGRIVIHLGYYNVPGSQGLQLKHWFEGEIDLNVLILPDGTDDRYLNIAEKLISLEFNPKCGKH